MKKLFSTIFFLFIYFSVIGQCDNSKNPIVFIHGFLASGDTYAGQIRRFIEAGYCADRLFVFDWNSISGKEKRTDSLLNVFIDSLLIKTGASQVDLVGHSAGGGLGRGYISDSLHALKVSRYIHLGSGRWNKDLSWFPNSRCLNIFSKGDLIAGSRAGKVEGANNLDLENKDHYEVATSQETFNYIFSFLNQGKETLGIRTTVVGKSTVAGKAVYLGENSPMKFSRVNFFEIFHETGWRKKETPDMSFIVDEAGQWGPGTVSKNRNYEIELVPADEKERKISYYFRNFKNDDHFIYLRGFPTGNQLARMLGNMPSKDDQSVIIIYSAEKAMIAGRDSVTINSIPICSVVLTPAARTIISSFIFEDGDGRSSGEPLKAYKIAPFIGGVDISLPVSAHGVNTVYYNGSILHLPSIPSSQRIMIAVIK